MEKLVELSEQEVHIDFQLNCKCRANVRLKSLSTTTPIAFKVQTSSPNKFLVNPPNGLIPPLSYATFQIILKPQTQLPPSFPRSPSDRFLVKTAKFHNSSESTHPIQSGSVNYWFSSETHLVTYDLKLKVAYVGTFLLRHAISVSDLDAVKNMVKRQKTIVKDLSLLDSESLIRLVTECSNSDKLIALLSEAGLKINARAKLNNGGDIGEESKIVLNGWKELHVEDEEGAVVNTNGQTALYTAAKNGDRPMVDLVMEMGADEGRIAVDLARDKGHVDTKQIHTCTREDYMVMQIEVVNIPRQGELVLTTARRGEVDNLEQLLKSGANANHKDQYGLTALHTAAIKGHKDVVAMLIDFGMDLECLDREGHTALHLAVEGGNYDTVELLVNNGANVNAISKKGATPIYMAKAMGYDDISEFLLSRGASSLSLPSSSSLSML